MIEQWLQTRTTVAEVEPTYGWGGNQHERWEQLEGRMMDDDELWEYCQARGPEREAKARSGPGRKEKAPSLGGATF